MKRPTAGGLLRLAVATALVGYTLWRSDPRAVWRAGAGAALPPLIIAAVLVLVDRALMAYRWFVLLRPLERERLPPFRTILRIFFVSTFVGTFLPASIGGDAVRAYSLSRHDVPATDAVASVFLDRMLGVLSVLLMALLGLVLIPRDLAANAGVILALVVTTLICAVTALLVFSNAADHLAAATLARLPGGWGRRLAGELIASVRRYSTHHGDLALVLAGSMGVQVLRIVQAYYLGVSLGVPQPLATYFAFVPLILLVMLLPITVNGIGTSQAAFIWLFAQVGTSEAQAFTLSVLFVALGIVGNLPGAILYAAGSDRGGQDGRQAAGA